MFPRRNARLYQITVAVLIVTVLIGLAVYWMFSAESDPYEQMSDEEILAAASAFYESRPYYERPFPYSEVPEGLPDIRSETCGQCHGEIHAEWSISTHRRAWKDDAQFMEELAKARGDYYEDQEGDYSWMCVNCHTPTFPQLERLVVDLEDGDIGQPVYVDNPIFDEEMQLEAIGCATCHVQDGTVYGPRGDTDAPHATARGDHLMDEQNCVRCHQAEALYPDDVLGCFFTTGEEWKHSPAAEQGKLCQDCHMPQTTRPLAEAYDVPERTTRRHWFGGSLIPKHPDFEEEIAELRSIFGSGATISIDAHPTEDRLAVRVHNKFAGHLFPTGDPERHVEVAITVRDGDDEVLTEAFERIGSRYEWYPTIELLSDNRIPPGESLYIDIDWPDSPTELNVEIEAHKYRMYEDDFDYHDLEGRYVRGRSFHHSQWTVKPGEHQAHLERIEDDLGKRDELEAATTPPSNR